MPSDPPVGIYRHLGICPRRAHRGEAQRPACGEISAARQPGARVDGHGLQGELTRCPRLRGVASQLGVDPSLRGVSLQRWDVALLGVLVVGEVLGQSRLVQPRLDGLVLPCPVAVHQCLPVDGGGYGDIFQLGQLRNACYFTPRIAVRPFGGHESRCVEPALRPVRLLHVQGVVGGIIPQACRTDLDVAARIQPAGDVQRGGILGGIADDNRAAKAVQV